MVDSTIQSLIQSPYIRTLASIPSKSEKLVHGISDNAPPMSRRRVYLQPSQGQNTLRGAFRFDIPRIGLLDQATLRVRVKHGVPFNDLQPNVFADALLGLRNDSVIYFSNSVDSIELYSKQRFIERLDGRAIHWENLMHTESEHLHYTGSYADVNKVTGETAVPLSQLPDTVSGASKRVFLSSFDDTEPTTFGSGYPEFSIPLPFACFSNLKKNFQTYFVENLSIVVNMKPDPYFHSTASSQHRFFLEMTCDYHQYHPNVETVIRNANYKQGIPATLPWYDWIRFDRVLVNNARVKTYSLESDALISDLLIVPKNDLGAAMKIFQDYYVVITANSEVLYESTYSDAISSLGSSRLMDSVVSGYQIGAMTKDYQRAYFPIVFGLYRSNDHFTGGMSLASLNDARIHIYPNRAVYTGSATAATASCTSFIDNIEFDIVAKRHYLLRVDSDTGVMTRTIES